MAERDPRGLLEVLGVLPANAKAVVKPLPREIITPVLEADQLYHIERGREKWLAHIEFQAKYRAGYRRNLVYYAMAGSSTYKLAIQSVLVLVDPRQAPKEVPAYFVMRAGGLTVRLDYHVVKLWELDGRKLFDHPKLLPLTLLTRPDENEIEEAAERLAATGDNQLAADFCLVGRMRYDKRYLEQLLARHGMSLIPLELFEHTEWYKEATTKGRAEGLALAIEHLLKRRFPGMGAVPALKRIKAPEQLKSILDLALETSDSARVRKAITSAARAKRDPVA